MSEQADEARRVRRLISVGEYRKAAEVALSAAEVALSAAEVALSALSKAEKERDRLRLKDLSASEEYEHVQQYARNMLARAEAAEKERDELREALNGLEAAREWAQTMAVYTMGEHAGCGRIARMILALTTNKAEGEGA